MSMSKARAIELLGGTPTAAGRALGVTSQAISQWPDVLSARTVDRVLAALVRQGRIDLVRPDELVTPTTEVRDAA